MGVDGVFGLQASTVFTPSTSTPISGYGSNIRPRIEGNDPNANGLIGKPDISKYNDAHEERLRAVRLLVRLEAEKEELTAVTDPRKLQAQLSQWIGRSSVCRKNDCP